MAGPELHALAGTWQRRAAVSLAVFIAAMAAFALISFLFFAARQGAREGHSDLSSAAPPRAVPAAPAASTPQATIDRDGKAPNSVTPQPPSVAPVVPSSPPSEAPGDTRYEMELARGKSGVEAHMAHRRPDLETSTPSPNAASPSAPPARSPASSVQPTVAAPPPKPVPPVKFASFNKPQSLYVYETQTVQAVLSATKSQPGDPNFTGLQGPVTSTGPIALRTYVTAKLIASKDLLEIDPPDQGRRIVGDKDIVFLWDIKPLKIGPIPITLELYSQDGSQPDAPLDVFKVMHDSWTVQARGLNRVDYWIDQFKPLQVEIWTLCSGIASVMTFFGLKFARDRTPPAKPPAAQP